MDVATQAPPQPSGNRSQAAGRPRRRPRLVVGVDGSPGSRAALGHALTTSARRGADLEVVSTSPVTLSRTGGAPVDIPRVVIRDDVESRTRTLVAEVRRDPAVAVVPGVDEVPVSAVVTVGPAAQELVDRPADADLLVVGSRGRGAVRSALVGSVALHCAPQAPCPVMVVRPHSGRAAGAPPEPALAVG